MIRKIWMAIAVGVFLVGCSGNDDVPPEESEDAPADVALTVRIFDPLPLDIYFNLDDEVCTSSSFSDALDGIRSPRVKIVVRDADGSIVASETAPRSGGTNAPKGCTVPVTMTVPFSDFYEVEVTGGSTPISRSATVQVEENDDSASVEVQF